MSVKKLIAHLNPQQQAHYQNNKFLFIVYWQVHVKHTDKLIWHLFEPMNLHNSIKLILSIRIIIVKSMHLMRNTKCIL